MITIETVGPDDKTAILDLLKKAALPTEDLPEGLPDFVMAKDDHKPTGVAGLESFGSFGLLRSVAVDPAYQGHGIASQLVQKLATQATTKGLKELYLITTTADRYFDRHGFTVTDRALVPHEIRQTPQFSGLCPSSAIVMKRLLKENDL